MKYLIFLFLLPTQIILSENITDSTIVTPEAEEYHFIWEDPKETDGCWKIGRDKSITKAPDISKKECKRMHYTGKWIEYVEVSYNN